MRRWAGCCPPQPHWTWPPAWPWALASPSWSAASWLPCCSAGAGGRGGVSAVLARHPDAPQTPATPPLPTPLLPAGTENLELLVQSGRSDPPVTTQRPGVDYREVLGKWVSLVGGGVRAGSTQHPASACPGSAGHSRYSWPRGAPHTGHWCQCQWQCRCWCSGRRIPHAPAQGHILLPGGSAAGAAGGSEGHPHPRRAACHSPPPGHRQR